MHINKKNKESKNKMKGVNKVARKIFAVIAILMFILTLSSCQKGVPQQEYDVLKAQLYTANSELGSLKAQLYTASSELSSYKESAKQAEEDLSNLKSKVASVKQYADIISADS